MKATIVEGRPDISCFIACRYGQNDILPPRCPIGEFCPDEEDHCRPLLPIGGACQLNRDGEPGILNVQLRDAG